jgi:hypothetical protein
MLALYKNNPQKSVFIMENSEERDLRLGGSRTITQYRYIFYVAKKSSELIYGYHTTS